MGDPVSERRQQRRRERQRRRRQRGTSGPSYEPIGQVQFTGIMGLMQRQARILFLVGIVVMILSLGSIFFVTQLGGSSPSTDADGATATPTAVASVEATPTATSDDPVIVRTYDAAPAMEIDVEQDYEAVITLEDGGEVRLELLPDAAPGYVNNFVFLARNHFYDGLTFHRVVPGFVAQAGDPTGSGFGDAGYTLAEETNDLAFGSGVLSMAKSGAIVNGSQFFITLGPAPHLESGFTVFGRVTDGLDVLRAFEARDPVASETPGPTIASIEIVEGG
jgi:peptidylprolyl isomerase